MEFNKEQAMTTVRWVVSTFGGAVAGFVAGKGWVSADTVMNLISSETFISIAASVAMFVWGFIARSKKNQVASVAAMEEVKAVVLEPKVITAAPELVNKTPENVVPAGTTTAEILARQ